MVRAGTPNGMNPVTLKPPVMSDAPNQPSNYVFPMHQFGQKKMVKRAFNPKWFSNWKIGEML